MNIKVDQNKDVLIVVDVQNDFCPGGKLPVPYGYEVVPVINWLAKKFDNVILTQDWHPEGHTSFASTHNVEPYSKIGDQVYWPDHCIQGTKGADFHPSLDIPHAQLILRKGFRKNLDSYSAFIEADRTTVTGLSGYVGARGFNRFFVVGLALDYCVMCTAKDARLISNNVFVVHDACKSIGDSYLARITLYEYDIKLTTSSDLT
jgi:nicotinamidase/pyrazinamidase